jgi:hypothetical protein
MTCFLRMEGVLPQRGVVGLRQLFHHTMNGLWPLTSQTKFQPHNEWIVTLNKSNKVPVGF